MTDRYHSLTVGLEHNIRDDDAQAIINAIRMIKGVLAVEGNVADSSEWIGYERARSEFVDGIFDLLNKKDAK